MTINIITRCTRQENLLDISKSIFNNLFTLNQIYKDEQSQRSLKHQDQTHSLKIISECIRFQKI
jgi:hypothetical protein